MRLCPDRWKIVKITYPNGEVIHSVSSGWVGGYLGSDEWRLSSPIIEVLENNETKIVVYTKSHTHYQLIKNREGMTGYQSSVLEGIIKKNDDHTFEIVEGYFDSSDRLKLVEKI